jgi:NADH-quinone oxidoreductase subunit L
MGAVGRYMKYTMVTMLAGGLALAGFPLTTGFFSKDEILVVAYEYGAVSGQWIPYVFGILGALMTAFYTFRMWFLTFDGEARSNYHKHESPWIMLIPLIILAIFALGFGGPAQHGFYEAVGNNFELYDVDFAELAAIGGHTIHGEGHGAEAAETSKAPGAEEVEAKAAEAGGAQEAEGAESEVEEPFIIKILPILVGVGGIFFALLFYSRWKKLDIRKYVGGRDPLRNLLVKRYYQHEILTAWFAETIVYGLALISNMIDIKIIDGFLNWVSEVTIAFGGNLRKIQTGVVQNYITALVLGIVILVIGIKLAVEVGL